MGERIKFFAGNPDEMVVSCRACGATDFYLQKDFQRWIAISIVLLGVVTVPWTYGLSLIAVALIDFVIYRRVPWMTVCYKCRAQYRRFKKNPSHQEFDRHLDELYQYGK